MAKRLIHTALCRCGGSAREPWSDDTYEHNGFRSD